LSASDAHPVRTLFFGSGTVALPALSRLLQDELVEITCVVTAPPRAAGRKGLLTPTPVADLAGQHDLPVRTPHSLRDEGVQADLRALDPALIVLADYGRLIPAAVLDLARHGALNIHPSLLPRHRGAAPVVGTILAGDGVGGVTVMRMDEGLDTGPIVAQREVPLDGTEVAPTLEARLAELGAELLVQVLPGWLEGSTLATPQPAEGATLTRLLRREDGRLDPTRPAAELERQVRAYQPWPGSFLEHDRARLKVWAASVLDQHLAVEPGALILTEGTLGLGTVAGVLRLDEVQPAGKRRMSGAEYRRGQRL
jgi:methionyl-tRNA formyltransferase